jgi:putative spermidine/putrescine transport system substrate-binding protein
MAEEFEGTDELLEQIREHQRLTGTEPKDEESNGMTRRDLLVKGGVAAAGLSTVGALAGRAAAATSKTGAFTGTLNVISLGVEFPTPEVAQKIKQELGFSVNVTATDPVTEVQKAITAPETFDIFGGYNYQDI